MSPRLPRTWRYNLVFGLLMLGIPALCVHVGLAMRERTSQALQMAERQQQTQRPLPARTGTIYARARRGYVPLAVSRQVASCFADPLLLQDSQLRTVAGRLADVLDIDRSTLRRELLSRSKDRFVWVKHEITRGEIDAIKAMRDRAVGVQYEWRREYPSRQLGATVVGFRLRDGRGGGGLELALERYLTAKDGKQVAFADASRRAIWGIPESSSPPRDGSHIFLCLDTVIQGFLQQAVSESVERFDAEWGTGVVVNPKTGEVLGMCSVPTFDPNAFNTAAPEHRTNRAMCTPFEPGSAFKPIIAAAAVEAGVLTWDSDIDCESGVYYARRGGRISDHGKSFNVQALTDVIVYSSNIGMAKVGEMLGNPQLYEIAHRFGFGCKTGIGLPGESGGQVRPLRQWNGYTLRRIPFGQEISVTAVQLVMGFCSLVNGGVLLRPRVVDFITDPTGRIVRETRPEVVRRVLSPQVAAQTQAVLREVVERGTGKRCRLSSWTSFGKTGTSQVAGVGGYNDQDYCASFVGGAPGSDPEVVCLISIYLPDRSKGYYGAKVAGPYVKEVLEKTLSYLEVPPDVRTGRQGGRMVAAAP